MRKLSAQERTSTKTKTPTPTKTKTPTPTRTKPKRLEVYKKRKKKEKKITKKKPTEHWLVVETPLDLIKKVKKKLKVV